MPNDKLLLSRWKLCVCVFVCASTCKKYVCINTRVCLIALTHNILPNTDIPGLDGSGSLFTFFPGCFGCLRFRCFPLWPPGKSIIAWCCHLSVWWASNKTLILFTIQINNDYHNKHNYAIIIIIIIIIIVIMILLVLQVWRRFKTVDKC